MPLVEFLLSAIAAVPAFGRRGRDNIALTVKNIGQVSLDSVMVLTTGRSYPIGPLTAGGVKRVQIGANGESHIEIEHGGDPRRRMRVGTYFENDSRGTIEVRLTGDSVFAVVDSVIL